jgi:hypothetical protein
MNEPLLAGYFQILLLVAFVIPVVFFFLTQQRTLELIRPENRLMRPGQVWLQFIPLFGLVWQFIVVTRISDSIRKELNTPTGDSIFAEETVPSNLRPTYNTGMSYATLFCITILPLGLFKSMAALFGLVLWITYWVQLSQYKKKLKERALLSNSGQ